MNNFLAGKPKSKHNASAGKVKPLNRKRKRKVIEVGDGSTGVFDDSDVSSSEDETSSAVKQIRRQPGQHELLNLDMHRKVFAGAWMSLMRTNLSESDVKRILVMLHRQVMPHLPDPAILIDFLADCCDYGAYFFPR